MSCNRGAKSMISEAKRQTRRRHARSRLVLVLLIAGLCLPAAFGVRRILYRVADLSGWAPRPAPRIKRDAPFIKSPDVVVDKMIEIAGLSKDDVVYDLGCGDGRIVITAAVKSGCRGVGFDNDPQRVQEAIENAKRHGVEDRVRIEQQDVFQVDLRDATVVMMYLLPWMVADLVPQLTAMQPGSRIVSHDFFPESVQADKEVEVLLPDGSRHGVYLCTPPLKYKPKKPTKR